MKINWKVRFKNPTFWIELAGSILFTVLAYLHLTAEDLTTWAAVSNLFMEVIKNPYLIGLILMNLITLFTDPTTKGIGDSEQAMTYNEPK